MGTQSAGGGGGEKSIVLIKEMRQELESRIETQHSTQLELISSLQTLVPNIVSSLDLSLKVVSLFNNRPFSPTPISFSLHPPPASNDINNYFNNNKSTKPSPNSPSPGGVCLSSSITASNINHNHDFSAFRSENSTFASAPGSNVKIDDAGSPLNLLRSIVANCLLQRNPFNPIDSSTVLRKLENDQNASPVLRKLENASVGPMAAVEMALRSMADDSGAVELGELEVSGKSGVMVLSIDRARLANSENKAQVMPTPTTAASNIPTFTDTPTDAIARPVIPQDIWDPSIYPRPMPPRVVPVPIPRGMRPNPQLGLALGPNAMPQKNRTEEDDFKDLEALLNKKSFREMQKSKTGEELLDLIHRPTAKETAVAAKFKTKGGSQLKEYCTALTKEDCRRQSGSFIACEKVHFRRIIALHTDVNLGDCSFLDTCRHMKTCKYVHYELDPTPDVPPMMMGTATLPPKPLKPQRAEYCSEVELGEPQWINCDIRNFRMDILGQFGVIMADPPWDIHMELPYGTMADDEMRSLNVPALQTDGLIFLWVTGRAMELGRECLELWGYKRVEEIIWVKTNQLQRIIRTGRTGHWLNHSKEHCLVGIKGNPEVNRNIDTDVIVAEVRETSRKPDEMYPLLERISPRTRKLELFARMHNTHAGWMSLGNQLSGVRLVDEGLRARFKAAYPEVEVQPASPPRASAMDIDSNAGQVRSPFSGSDAKSMGRQFSEGTTADPTLASEAKPMNIEVEMVS